MRRKFTLCVVILIALIFPIEHPQAQESTPQYAKTECQFPIPEGRTMECGTLTVPEDRSKPAGPTITIAVGIVKALNTKAEPDPIIYLEGGPGAYSLESLQYSFSEFKAFATKRDFILFDQRGVGYSRPLLACPEESKVGYDIAGADLTVEQARTLNDKAIQACHDRLVKQRINLSAYNSAANAADLHDLRVALSHEYGYTDWNLYGISYGTRLALTEMRDFPDGLRSVVLDSTVPLQADLYGKVPANADRAFRVFFDGCKKDPDCNTVYPNLETEFYKLADALTKKPLKLTVQNPLTHVGVNLVINGNTLVLNLFESLYSTDLIQVLPKIITAARQGQTNLLGQLVMINLLNDNEFFSVGMYYSLECAEEASFDTPQVLTNADRNYPKQRKVLDMGRYNSICKIWGVKPAPPVENQPVTSDLRTLILSGEYDPITPPSYGQDAAKTLKNNVWLLFPGVGHGASVADRCPQKITMSFFDNPEQAPDTGCIAAMHLPKFLIN